MQDSNDAAKNPSGVEAESPLNALDAGAFFSADELLARGYIEHPVPFGKMAHRFFQRRVRDSCDPSRRTLYFINVFHFLHDARWEGWQTEAQFDLESGASANVEIFSTSDIDEAEKFIATAYGALGVVPYSDRN